MAAAPAATAAICFRRRINARYFQRLRRYFQANRIFVRLVILCRRIPNEFAVPIDVAPGRTDLYRRQVEGEGLGVVELRADHHLAVLVDESPVAARAHRGPAVHE